MKLFKFTSGWTDVYGAFDSKEEAYDRRSEIDQTYHWTPVEIEEIVLEGYEITVTPEAPKNKGGRPRKEE